MSKFMNSFVRASRIFTSQPPFDSAIKQDLPVNIKRSGTGFIGGLYAQDSITRVAKSGVNANLVCTEDIIGLKWLLIYLSGIVFDFNFARTQFRNWKNK